MFPKDPGTLVQSACQPKIKQVHNKTITFNPNCEDIVCKIYKDVGKTWGRSGIFLSQNNFPDNSSQDPSQIENKKGICLGPVL